MFERVALIGIGLIGSSLSHAMRAGNLAAHDRRARTEREDARHGAAARARRRRSMRSAGRGGARTPISSSCARRSAPAAPSPRDMAPSLKPGAILTDVGSVKGAVVRDVGPYVPKGVHFIPGHPIAGTEHSGPESGFAELFDGRWCILTPPRRHRREPRSTSSPRSGRRCGIHVEIMDARASRPGARPSPATCRISSPTTSSTRPRHLEQVTELRGDQVLGRRLPRLHAHRRLRSRHVARRLPQQQGGGAGDARPLQRGPDRAAARHPLRRRRHAAQAVRGGARHAPRHHRGRPGYGRARFRPPARQSAPSQPGA